MNFIDRLLWRYLSWRCLCAVDLADECSKQKRRLVRKYARAAGCSVYDVVVDERGRVTVRDRGERKKRDVIPSQL
jgi:hypothetical protein